LRPGGKQSHFEGIAACLCRGDWILRDDTTIVFNLDLELGTWNDARAELKDLREAICLKLMIRVVADMGLENDFFFATSNTSAIDECFHDMPDFGEMGMRGNGISIWQDKAEECLRMRLGGS
jgi:hypothetical protein